MSRYARISRTRKRNKARIMRIQASIATVTLGLFLSLFVAVSAVALTAYSWLYDLPDYNEVSAFDTSQPTRIYAQDGTLIARLFLENREPVEMEDISPYVLQAIVAVEDERFFEHEGIDPQGIARAAVMTALGSREGGSTITQQYVRQTILRDEAQDMTVRRKVREAYLALEVEQHFTKDEILTMYLNTVYFGEGAHGIQIASLTYFGKNASELTLGEATILAGIPQRPNALNPYRNPDLTLQRRAHVLNRMYENNMITHEERREAEEEELELSRVESPDQGIYDAHYFVAHVRRELHRRFSQADVFGGGLVVHTTIDLDLQRAAETAVWDVIGRDPNGPEGALISQDTDTGKVIAMVGGRNYARSNFNMATQAHRHAGSSFKTFCLVAAIEEGMSPSFRISSSSPASIDTGGGSTWIVNNVEGRGRGMMSLQAATASSVNTLYARLVVEIGPEKMIDAAQRMGIQTELQPFPSLVLGAQGVTVLEMNSAYSTLATGGIYREPTFITEVIDRTGGQLYEWEVEDERALTPEVSWATTRVLQTVVTGGTARSAQIPGWQVAGKTGTSQHMRDVWFAGYTPVLSTTVWVGHPEEQTVFINGMRAAGGTVSAPIWHAFMEVALEGYEHRTFETAPDPPFDNSRFNFTRDGSDEDEDELDLDGLTLEEAQALLDGRDVIIEEVHSDSVPAGQVISSSFRGGRVVLRISLGPAATDEPEEREPARPPGGGGGTTPPGGGTTPPGGGGGGGSTPTTPTAGN